MPTHSLAFDSYNNSTTKLQLDMATNIQVAIRIRPFLPFEAGAKSCIDVLPGVDDEQRTQLTQGKSVRIVS